MSYQVLARKWRPHTFREMVGQEHVLQALVNALDHDRLHHAYLFTGTRGVGKTTIGRILAKCLNCEVGVSSSPCNKCSACVEINEGRFVDLIEVDAASRTKVEDTRELLENVQYAPTRGRYKVYLIDEVHMLSNSSFNALLKTLEEPPPHVKFLLATTDPQKLPVTILSRCLQFNLKNMNPERIVSHLQFVLDKEMVPFEEAALWQLARSADGSMRDALSLTDQAIAFGDGKVTDADVRTMLGTIDQTLVYTVVEALIAEDGHAVLTAVNRLSEHAPDYSAALAEMITVFHRIAIAQALPEAIDNSQGDRQQIYDFAGQIAAEDLQLYYQTALLGRRDLPLVPDPRSGFEMVLLRMLAFKPQGVAQLPDKVIQAQKEAKVGSEQAFATEPAYLGEGASESIKKPEPASVSVDPELQTPDLKPLESELVEPLVVEVGPQKVIAKPSEGNTAALEPVVEVLSSETAIPFEAFTKDQWIDVYFAVNPGGLLQSTVANCTLINKQGQQLHFLLDQQQSTLYDETHQERLSELLSQYFHQSVQVIIQIGDVSQATTETPAQTIIRRQQLRQRQAESAISQDPVIEQLQELFDASIVEGSIHPIDQSVLGR
jgi:DNA polymerase-3 subunit gamma/tau